MGGGNFIIQKLKAGLWNLQHNSHTIALSKSSVLAKKNYDFCNKMLKSAKLRGPWY